LHEKQDFFQMMNPLVMVKADYRAIRGSAIAIVLLVAFAVAIGVSLSSLEKSLRTGTTHAAADFDLVIGAPGSATQLVMTTVYVQPEALPLMAGRILKTLSADKRVKAFAPIAFGDVVNGYPVVGTTADFVTRWGRYEMPEEGRFFKAEDEAVIGHDVVLALGQEIIPAHGLDLQHTKQGEISADEVAHRHEASHLKIVGRLPSTGTPWDRTILVPIESVWGLHGFGNGHHSDGIIGVPFDAEHIPPIPAVVIKPLTISGAYGLRGDYRKSGLLALFPAEILVSLYRTLGDVKDIMLAATMLNSVLILSAVILLIVAIFSLHRRRYAILRALGASATYSGTVAWLGAFGLMTAGCVAGLGMGWALTSALSVWLKAETGLETHLSPDWQQTLPAFLLLIAGSFFACIPAVMAYRLSLHTILRGE
jgi:putative ABC transport system permease protein